MRRLALAAALAAGLAGCGGGGAKTLTVSGFDGPVHLDLGQRLAVPFDVNPGIGFEWEELAPGGAPVLRFTGSDATNLTRPGASGTRTFHFTAARRGRTAVVFAHFYRGKRVGTQRLAVRVG